MIQIITTEKNYYGSWVIKTILKSNLYAFENSKFIRIQEFAIPNRYLAKEAKF